VRRRSGPPAVGAGCGVGGRPPLPAVAFCIRRITLCHRARARPRRRPRAAEGLSTYPDYLIISISSWVVPVDCREYQPLALWSGRPTIFCGTPTITAAAPLPIAFQPVIGGPKYSNTAWEACNCSSLVSYAAIDLVAGFAPSNSQPVSPVPVYRKISPLP